MDTNILNIKFISVICIKQHLSNIWDSVHENVQQHWDRVEKSVAYKFLSSWIDALLVIFN